MERARTHIERLANQSICEPDFWAGFVAGQAEKVWLGAVPAAMFRPSADERSKRLEQVAVTQAEYGLCVTLLADEIWIHQPSYVIGDWQSFERNSLEYHALRAAACGIADVDPRYHERL